MSERGASPLSNWNGFQFNRFKDDLPEDDVDIVEVQYAQEITNPLDIIQPFFDAAKGIHKEGELFALLSEFWNTAYKTGYKDCILNTAIDNIDQLSNFDDTMFVNQDIEFEEEEYDEED